MKFLFSPPEIEAKIAEIRRKIRLSMNGIVSEQMAQRGIIYKSNYGVSLPRIKEMAREYAPDHDLAQRLWMLQIRETMILATLLEPPGKFTTKLADEWIGSFRHIEIVEQSCMNLFCKLPFARELALKWIQSEQLWTRITGYVLAARIRETFTPEDARLIVTKAVEQSDNNELHLYKAIALCLSRLARNGKETATYILKETEALTDSSSTGQQYISNEVKQEILFLDIL